MKFLILSGSHDVVVASNEQEAQKAKQSMSFDQVIRLDGDHREKSNVVAFPSGGSGGERDFDLNAQVDALEERLVQDAMAATGNNQVRAAKLLGITRGALQYKLKKIAAKGHQQVDDQQAA